MPRTITWLHLSDLHACRPTTGWDAARVLDTLQRDLKRMHNDHGLQPELIFFTGDAAFGHLGNTPGKAIADQFRVAHEFLTGVRKAFPAEIPQRNVFLVPGNHDVNRTSITDFETDWLDKQESLDEIQRLLHDAGANWRQLKKRLQEYEQALESLGYEHLLTNREHLTYADMREVAGMRIGIAGFNSSWSSRGAGREEMGRLWMAGRYQLETIRAKLPPHDFNIALIHHPGNWLVPEENPSFFRLLERDYQFILHGHEHQGFVRPDAARGHTVISAGACHEWSTGPNNGYSFARLDFDSAEGEVWLREYDSSGGWKPRVVPDQTNNDGRWPLPHLGKWLKSLLEKKGDVGKSVDQSTGPNSTVSVTNLTTATSASDPAADYETRYRKAVVNRLDFMHLFGVDDVPRDSRSYSLTIAYVSVNLSNDEDEATEQDDGADETRLPPREEKPLPESVADRLDKDSIPAEHFFDKLNGPSKRLLIRGVAGSGKTTLLRWAAVQAGQSPVTGDWRSRVPFFIRLRDYAREALPRPQDYPLLLARELPDPPSDWMTRILDEGRVLIMFDGADEVPPDQRDRVMGEIRQLMKTYPKNAYVVSTRPEAVEREEFICERFIPARIEELSSVARDKLIDQWHLAIERVLRDRNQPTDLKPLAAKLKTKLEENSAIARLTVNPLLCAVVCALHRDREDSLPETPVDLCDKLVEMLLFRRDRDRPDSVQPWPEFDELKGLDYRKRRGLAAQLAQRMIEIGQSSIYENDVDRLIDDALRAYRFETSKPAIIRQWLVERSGLLQESSEQKIEFVHNTLKEYLAAERFANQDAVEVLADHCHEESWRRVILFAVALPRDGSTFATNLLRAVMAKTPIRALVNGRSAEAIANVSKTRAQQFFFIRCYSATHQVDDPNVQRTFLSISDAILPPRDLEEATALIGCGEAIVPYLRFHIALTAIQRAACVRTLGGIGGLLAVRFLGEYVDKVANVVQREIIRAVAALIQDGTMFLEFASPITVLDLSHEPIRDVAALAGLTNLTTLNLRGTPVSDVFSLGGLSNLLWLNLESTQVSDVSGLRGLRNLTTLILDGTQVSDLSGLRGLTNLTTLFLDSTHVSDVSGLAELTNLTSLYLNSTQVSDVSRLGGLTNLKWLELHGTQVTWAQIRKLKATLPQCEISW